VGQTAPSPGKGKRRENQTRRGLEVAVDLASDWPLALRSVVHTSILNLPPDNIKRRSGERGSDGAKRGQASPVTHQRVENRGGVSSPVKNSVKEAKQKAFHKGLPYNKDAAGGCPEKEKLSRFLPVHPEQRRKGKAGRTEKRVGCRKSKGVGILRIPGE